MHSNRQILSAVLANWAKPLIDEVLVSRLGALQPVAAANEWVKKYFPVAKNYSIVKDLAFLAVPAKEIIIEPAVGNAIERMGVSDEQIPAYAAKIVNSLLDEAEKNGKVTLFNTIELDKSDFERLKSLLEKNLPFEEKETYKVIE